MLLFFLPMKVNQHRNMEQFPVFPVQAAHPYYGLNHLILTQG